MTLKATVSVYLDRDLRDRARANGICLSHTLTQAIQQQLEGGIQ